MLDFNNAGKQTDEFDLIPDGTIVPVQMTLRPGNAGEGGWLKRSKSQECQMLDAEFVVLEGPYARRKFWSMLVVDGTTEGQQKVAEISVARIRAMLESARGIKPADDSADALERRRVTSYGDLDNLRFWGVVGIEKGKDGYKDKNVLEKVVTPDRSDWRQLDQVKATGSMAKTAPKASGAAPSWAA